MALTWHCMQFGKVMALGLASQPQYVSNCVYCTTSMLDLFFITLGAQGKGRGRENGKKRGKGPLLSVVALVPLRNMAQNTARGSKSPRRRKNIGSDPPPLPPPLLPLEKKPWVALVPLPPRLGVKVEGEGEEGIALDRIWRKGKAHQQLLLKTLTLVLTFRKWDYLAEDFQTIVHPLCVCIPMCMYTQFLSKILHFSSVRQMCLCQPCMSIVWVEMGGALWMLLTSILWLEVTSLLMVIEWVHYNDIANLRLLKTAMECDRQWKVHIHRKWDRNFDP